VTDFCDQGNEPSCSIKGDEFLDYISDYQLLEKNCVTMELVSDLKKKLIWTEIADVLQKSKITSQ
jgi:hypothetical protein